MSREGKLVKNTMILAVGTFFPKLAIFVALPILTANLTTNEYGIYELVVTMVAFVLPASTLQVQSAAFRFLFDVKDDENEKTSIITNIFLFVSITSVIVLTAAFFVLFKLGWEIRLAICLYYFFDIYSNVSRQVIRGLFKNIDYSVSAIISGVGQILFVALFVMGLKKGLLGGLSALAIAELLSTVYLVYRGKLYKYIKPRLFSKKALKELLAYSWPMVPNSLSQWVIHSSDHLVIASFMGTVAAGIYGVAYKIPSILSIAQTTFNMAWQENASITSKDSDVSQYYSSMFEWLFNVVAGILSVIIGFTPILFKIFVRSDEYAAAYNQIPILFMGMFFLCLSTFWGGIFVALKKTKDVGITTVISAAINLSIDLIAVNWIGMYAGSISSVIAYTTLCLLRAIRVRKYIEIKYNVKHIAIVIAILLAQCVICFLQNTPLNIVNLIVGLGIGIALNINLLKTVFEKVKKLKHRA